MKVRSLDTLRSTIERSGMSYRQVAAAAGVSHATLANLARGGRTSCSDDTARRICFALDVQPSHLFLSDVYATLVQADGNEVRSDLRGRAK